MRPAGRGAAALAGAVVLGGGAAGAAAWAERGPAGSPAPEAAAAAAEGVADAGSVAPTPERAAQLGADPSLDALATRLAVQADARHDREVAAGYAAVVPRRTTIARDAPAGKRRWRVGAQRGGGGPLVLSVGDRRAGWVGVRLPERPNGHLAWLREADVRWRTLRVRVEVDESARTLRVRRDGRVVLRTRVAVGRAANPTPLGRFGVADKVAIPAASASPYGVGALPLTGHQRKLPPGWPGGTQVAIHGTPDEGSVGLAASSGCMRVRSADVRRLLREVPLGATVLIRA